MDINVLYSINPISRYPNISSINKFKNFFNKYDKLFQNI